VARRTPPTGKAAVLALLSEAARNPTLARDPLTQQAMSDPFGQASHQWFDKCAQNPFLRDYPLFVTAYAYMQAQRS
jgi:hypothetical protein